MDICLEVNAKKTKCLLFRHQNPGQNLNMNIANLHSENVAQFKYFGTIITYQI
jgi:hypothetical protein